MAVDLKNLKKTEVSTEIGSRYIFLYGDPKGGKTTLAAQFPDALFLATEKGYNNISNIYVQDIANWVEMRKAVKQLADPEVKKMFKTIVIDTYSLACKRAEAFVCNREGVDTLSQIPYGGGYSMVEDEISNVLSQISQLGYGLVAIAHAKRTTIDDGTMQITTIQPDLDKRAGKIINRMVDATICLYNDGEKRMLYPRDYTITDGPTKIEIKAGNRVAGLDEPIDLSYEALNNAIKGAIKTNNKKVVNKEVNAVVDEVKYNFEQLKTDIGTIVKELATLDKETGTSHMVEYKRIVTENLGEGKLVKDCTEKQAPILDLIYNDLVEYKKSI